MKLVKSLTATAVVAAFGLTAPVSAATLDDVKAKGFIQCGVSQGVSGFSNPDAAGNWSGIDVDVCRAVSAAIFGDANKVKYSPLTAKERFTALQSGEIDLLSRNTTWTLVRDTALGLNFAGVNYYDGQGFMVRKDLGVKSAMELSRCIRVREHWYHDRAEHGRLLSRSNKMDYKPVVVREGRRSGCRIRLGSLRRVHHGPVSASCRSAI